MNDKIGPFKGFKPMDVEVEEIIEDILEGDLFTANFNATHLFCVP